MIIAVSVSLVWNLLKKVAFQGLKQFNQVAGDRGLSIQTDHLSSASYRLICQLPDRIYLSITKFWQMEDVGSFSMYGSL